MSLEKLTDVCSEEAVKDHLSAQPYSITCNECGNELSVTVAVDGDLDLIITADPCQTCMKQAEQHGYEQGKETQKRLQEDH